MHFQIVLFAVEPMAPWTFKILNAFMGFQVLAKVAYLAEGSVAVQVSTPMGFFFRVGHEMAVEFCNAVNNFVTLMTFFVFVCAFEDFVLFF